MIKSFRILRYFDMIQLRNKNSHVSRRSTSSSRSPPITTIISPQYSIQDSSTTNHWFEKQNILYPLQIRYHPAVVRAFLEYEDNPSSPNYQSIRNLRNWACRVLVSLESKGCRNLYRPMHNCHFPHKVEEMRSYTGDLIISLLLKKKDKHLEESSDSVFLAACLRILMPRSDKFWVEIDSLLTTIHHQGNIEPQASLLFSHALLSSFTENGFTHLVLRSIPSSVLSVNKFIQQGTFEKLTAPRPLSPSDSFPASVLDVPIIEQFGLYLELLCASGVAPSSNYQRIGNGASMSSDRLKGFDSVASSTLQKCYQTLKQAVESNTLDKSSTSSLTIDTTQTINTSQTEPKSNLFNQKQPVVGLRLSTLIHLAIHTAILRTPPHLRADHDILLSKIFELISASLQTDIYQLLHEELRFTEFLEAIITTSYSETRQDIISTIWTFYQDKGLDFKAVGSRLFNALVQLDCPIQAMQVLDLMIERAGDRADLVFMPIKKKNVMISDAAKQKVHTKLSVSGAVPLTAQSQAHQLTDLILALYCFSRENKQTRFYRFFEGLEHQIIGNFIKSAAPKCSTTTSIQSESVFPGLNSSLCYTPTQALKILHSYALVGRKHPDLIKCINSILTDSYASLRPLQLSLLLWCNARLNNTSAKYNKAVADLYLKHLYESKAALSVSGSNIAARSLWAMALLQVLSIEDFLSVEPHLQRMVGALDRSDTHPQLIAQLKQVLTELRLQSVPNSSVDTSKTHALISAHRAWEDAVTFKYPPTSSYTHQDVSRVLTSLGISHENEKQLEFSLIVDIFIPCRTSTNVVLSPTPLHSYEKYRNSSANSHVGGINQLNSSEVGDQLTIGGKPDQLTSRGIVLEIDGPFHFDSYLQMPLGSTAMKRRHLIALGYTVVSLDTYDVNSTIEYKERLLKSRLEHLVQFAGM